jgi:hypothetical protein
MADEILNLKAVLRESRVARAPMLAKTLGVSQPTLSRLLRRLGPEVVPIGAARQRRYALSRRVRGLPASQPLFRVLPTGRGERIGVLQSLEPEGFVVDGVTTLGWPLGDMHEGYFEGLPYFLYDSRPQGFLGRAFATRRARALSIPEDPTRWSDDDVLVALSLAGEDLPGDLVVGESSYERLLERMRESKPALEDAQLALRYPELADQVLEGGPGGSSAGGEFPKFTATLQLSDEHQEVIVKFSAADDTAAARRWADLLIAESIAAKIVGETLFETAPSRILHFAGRTFLEVARSDRVGAWGRRAICTLSSIDAALLGLGDARWDRAAEELRRLRLIDENTRESMLALWSFGGLIANTDMHPGNLAFWPSDGLLALRPVYDMLPMLYAPLRSGEVPMLQFRPGLPMPGLEAPWRKAAAAARAFWQACEANANISAGFRAIAGANADAVEELRAKL